MHSIFHDNLRLPKACARWMPYRLANDQKQMRIQFCQKWLDRFEEGRFQPVFDDIIGDKSLFYHYVRETEEPQKTRMPQDCIRPMKVRWNKSSGKRMVVIFFMKSSLIKSIPLVFGALTNSYCYIHNFFFSGFWCFEYTNVLRQGEKTLKK